VVSHGQNHEQTFGEPFNPAYVTTGRDLSAVPELPHGDRRTIGERALREIRPGEIVNLGIGLPETVAQVAAATGRLGDFTLTVESGPIGGIPASGLSFGCSHHPEAVIDQPAQFDFYDGGGLDIAVLGAVEIDPEGSVNVTSFADRFAGVGGFMNIAQSARRLVFCCTFLAKGQPKFVKKIQHVCFHGPSALARGQQVLYITERAVFELTEHGLRLTELTPGYALQTDILDHMQFTPLVGV
jgi:propionate CoA-transferase